jgi:ribosome-binding protein aMBF1 (putative translation factor)
MVKQPAKKTTTKRASKKTEDNYRNKRRVHKTLDINERFRFSRKWMGWTMDEFAERLHITPSTVKNIEHDKVTPNIEIIRRWKIVTGRTFDWIINGTPERVLQNENEG